MKKLVKFNTDWADEMTIEGFEVFTDEEWQAYKDGVEAAFKETDYHEVYFGTNEFNGYGSAEEFLGEFTVTEITEEEAFTLGKLFKPSFYGYGQFPSAPGS